MKKYVFFVCVCVCLGLCGIKKHVFFAFCVCVMVYVG